MEGYEQALAKRSGTSGVAEENLQSRGSAATSSWRSPTSRWLRSRPGTSRRCRSATHLYATWRRVRRVKDVPKLLVYALVENRNAGPGADLIPASRSSAALAELRPDQLDTDTLPP